MVKSRLLMAVVIALFVAGLYLIESLLDKFKRKKD